MKFLAIAVMALLSVGCASKSDLKALSGRVDALETKHTAIETEHAQIVQDHAALSSSVGELNARVDRAFAKGKK